MKSVFQNIFKALSSVRLEYYWLVYAILFGTFLALFLPPFQVMDEHQHFQKAYGITEGYVFCIRNQDNKPGIYAPTNIANAPKVLDVSEVPYNSTMQVSERNMEIRSRIKAGGGSAFIQHPFCESPPWSTFPPALGIGIARMFDLPILAMVHLGRIINLLVAVVLIFFAIRITPVGKRFFFITAALPMFMQQISSLSLDAFHYSSLFLFTAWTLKLSRSEEPFDWKKLALYTLFSIFAIHAKLGFIFMIGLVLLLPWKKFPSKKMYAAFTAGFAALHFLLFVLIRNLLSVSDLANQGAINREEQIAYAISHPFDFLYAVAHSIGMYFDFYWKNMLGILGWTDASLLTLHYVLIIFVLATVITMKSEDKVTIKDRGVLSITWILVMLSIFGALYAISTPVGDNYVHLVQGKYFLPVFPLLLLAISQIPIKKWIQKVFLVVFLITNVALVYHALDKRYYASVEVPTSSIETVQDWIDVDGKGKVSAVFTATEDNLQGVSIYFKRGEMPQGIYRFALRDSTCSRILTSKEIAVSFVPEEGYMDLLFDTQLHSKGQTYCWTVDPDLRVVASPLSIATVGKAPTSSGTVLSTEKAIFLFKGIYKR